MPRIIKLCFKLFLMLLLTAACVDQTATPGPVVTSQAATGEAAPTASPSPVVEDTAIQVFFTVPAGSTSEPGALEKALLADLGTAQTSIDVAMYNFSLRRVTDALITAKQRGVRVRFVADSDALDGSQFNRLAGAEIKVVGDRRESLMHHKFIVIDGQIVWTGSLNLTGSGMNADNNNLVRLESTQLAENYTHEFEEMFLNDIFGSDSPADTPFMELTIGETAVENYFAPDDRVLPRLVRMVNAAQSSVELLAYSFTSDPLAKALQSRANAGLLVRGVFDENMVSSNQGSDYQSLKQAGLDVRLDGSEGLMHDKVIILDRVTVILGSYNFTASADRRNDENIVVIHDARVAQQFLAEFERIYEQAGN